MKNSKKLRIYLFFKRLFDITSSFILIVITSPILIILSLIVKINSSGPVIFKDKRVGKNGKMFNVYKFRTMYKDAEERLAEYLTPDQLKVWQTERKIDNDPRITKVGLFLRKTSLDELPQLFNILFGSMSVVGPRPISMMEYKTHYSVEEQGILNQARPGLIGCWAVYGRSNIEFETGERQKLELSYFEKRGFFYDLKLIFMVIPVVFLKKGAK